MKKKIKGQYRQGDVLIERKPKRAAAGPLTRAHSAVTLAEGEATGHKHQLLCEDIDVEKLTDGRIAVTPALPAPVRHEEHGTIELEPERHEVTRQREYTPGATRQVAD